MLGEGEAVQSRGGHWAAEVGTGLQRWALGCRGGHWDAEAGTGMQVGFHINM